MNYRERVEEIAACLATLPGAGQVHARNRVTTDWGQYLERFKAEDRIAGWTVSRYSTPDGEGDAHHLEVYTLIRIYGVHDASASEWDFQQSLDDAIVYWRDNPALSWGTVVGKLKLGTIEERLFGAETLCHVAECVLTVAMYFDDLTGSEP